MGEDARPRDLYMKCSEFFKCYYFRGQGILAKPGFVNEQIYKALQEENIKLYELSRAIFCEILPFEPTFKVLENVDDGSAKLLSAPANPLIAGYVDISYELGKNAACASQIFPK